MKQFILWGLLALSVGCASSENQLRQAIKKNPKIIFDAIEDNPELFIEVVNRAAQKAQRSQYEKQLSEMKNEQERDLKNPKQPKLESERRLIGNDSGKIVVVEYADFQCPACRVAHESLKQFKDKYRGQVQFYFKNMPLDFHKMAYPAAQYYEAIFVQDKAKAAQFFDHVFENQREMTDENFLKKAARHVGADLKRVERDLKSDVVKGRIKDDMDEFQGFGFTGTPVLILNGVALHGAQRLEELERVVGLTSKR